ncbi:MAG TPA: Mur ligase family protein [Gemmatimonadales bacterium]|nr:Mur ligase family protein [Gemmatimonadales bacterium]
MTYEEALRFLFPRTTTIKFGLGTTEALLERIGRPDRVIPTIHIGGTNGKGSVATLVSEALMAAGWRVGLYTSPHLVTFRERILVDRVPVSEAAVATWVAELRPLIEELGATFFEASTVVAFADIAARGAEIAVVEVGLGGRLDSTNVVRPLVSAITKIEMDHQKYLGETLEAIATEKAWIAKPGAPCVVGESRASLLPVIAREADAAVAALEADAKADLRVVPPDALWDGPLGLAGPHQRRNAAIAHAVLKALPERWRPAPEAIAAGFGAAHVAGRLDRRGKWLFDVAHNPDGMRSLVAALKAEPPPGPVHAIVSILGDKAWPEMLVALDQVVDQGILTVAPSADTRRWDIEWLTRWLKDPARPPARAEWALVQDFDAAMAAAEFRAGTVLVTGSFHTVGDVMAARGFGIV